MRLGDLLDEHIVKVKGGYRLVSKKTGRNLGTYPSRAGAEKRERQVQYFKHAGESVEESSNNVSASIRALYQKIYNAGDDEIDYFYHDSPIFAQYWDEYEGDIDSIIAEVDPKELQIIHDELESYVEGAGLAEGSLKEFAPSDSGDDGHEEDVLKKLAAQWWNGDEDPRAERALAAMGWEVGRDEGYDNGGVFVVRAGDVNGKSYISWPADELELNEAKEEKFDIEGLDPVTKKLLINIRSKYPWAKTDLEALLTYIKDEDTSLEKDIHGLENKDHEHDTEIDTLDTELDQEEELVNKVKGAEDIQNAKIADIEKKVNAIASRVLGRE